MRRLRAGELLAGGGAIALVALLFGDWFSADGAPGADASGWGSLGWPALAVAVIAVAAAAALVVTTARSAVSQSVGAGVITAVIGSIAFVVLAVRVLIARPNVGGGGVSVAVAGWLGLLATLLVAAGGWWSIADDRTDAPESAYVPPAPRPAPPR